MFICRIGKRHIQEVAGVQPADKTSGSAIERGGEVELPSEGQSSPKIRCRPRPLLHLPAESAVDIRVHRNNIKPKTEVRQLWNSPLGLENIPAGDSAPNNVPQNGYPRLPLHLTSGQAGQLRLNSLSFLKYHYCPFFDIILPLIWAYYLIKELSACTCNLLEVLSLSHWGSSTSAWGGNPKRSKINRRKGKFPSNRRRRIPSPHPPLSGRKRQNPKCRRKRRRKNLPWPPCPPKPTKNSRSNTASISTEPSPSAAAKT